MDRDGVSGTTDATAGSTPPRSLSGRIEGWLASDHLPAMLVAVATLMSLPSLGGGPYEDDHWLRLRVATGASPWFGGTADAAEVEHVREIGAIGWWGSKLVWFNFFRPIACALHYLEFTLWPNAYWAMHVVNVIVYAALVWVAAQLYRRMGLGAGSAGLAALMFAVDEGHALSVGWIAGRNTLISALFSLACVLEHVKARRANPSRISFTSAAFLALALLSSEAGVHGLAYVLAYALLLDSGKRFAALSPHALVLLVWIGSYLALHSGGGGINLYRDLSDPLFILGQGLLDLPVWLVALIGPSFAATAMAMANPTAIRLAALVLLVPLLLWVWPTARRHPLGSFFALGALLCIPPLFTTLPQDRLLIAPSFGAFGLIACCLETASEQLSRYARWGKSVMLALHVALAPCLFVFGLNSAGFMQSVHQHVFEELKDAGGREIVLINSPSEWVSPVVFCMLYNGGLQLPASFHQLYAGGQHVTLSRIDERTLELEVTPGWGGSPLEGMVSEHVPGRPRRGETIDLANLSVHILSETEDGMPQRARFTFPTPLEASGRRWYTWRGTELERWVPPAVGQQVALPRVLAFEAALRRIVEELWTGARQSRLASNGRVALDQRVVQASRFVERSALALPVRGADSSSPAIPSIAPSIRQADSGRPRTSDSLISARVGDGPTGITKPL